jgi:hypothetical protein
MRRLTPCVIPATSEAPMSIVPPESVTVGSEESVRVTRQKKSRALPVTAAGGVMVSEVMPVATVKSLTARSSHATVALVPETEGVGEEKE